MDEFACPCFRFPTTETSLCHVTRVIICCNNLGRTSKNVSCVPRVHTVSCQAEICDVCVHNARITTAQPFSRSFLLCPCVTLCGSGSTSQESIHSNEPTRDLTKISHASSSCSSYTRRHAVAHHLLASIFLGHVFGTKGLCDLHELDAAGRTAVDFLGPLVDAHEAEDMALAQIEERQQENGRRERQKRRQRQR